MLSLSLSACGKKEENTSVQKALEKEGIEVVERNSLSDWFGGDEVVECTIKSPEGDIVVITKGEDVYMEGVPFVSANNQGEELDSSNGVMLTLGDWTYMWDKATKKGTKINNKEMEDMLGGYEDEEIEDEDEFGEMAEEWEDSGFEYKCREIKEDKNMFKEPSGIEFDNLNDMMGGLKNMNDIMGGQDTGEDMDMDQLEKMMQGIQ
ncbi:MAG: hypothetical protein KAI79_03500 [Bacteroidales bacterium]|nr:hypothetical protein [Bacteroidales bacterium]